MSMGKKKKLNFFSSILKFFVLLIAFTFVVVSLLAGLVIYFNSPVQAGSTQLVTAEQDGIIKTEDGAYYIDVRKGESSQSVGLRLERAGLIKNRYFWNLLSRLEKEHIKSGTYMLETPISQIAIRRILVSGRQILYRVTIPEGVTLKKTAKILEEAGICLAGDFLETARDPRIISRYRIPNESMEGYLFPDTYLFPGEYPAEQVIRAMTDNFFNRVRNIDPLADNMSPQELNEKVIVASIVEREYRITEEASLMAGVFYNRLRINMALQSCATVEYIITEIQDKPHPAVIYNWDLEIRNPYNTYIMPGLPPGPISAPGIVALEAAIFPEKTDYLYFRLDNVSSGRHYFSKTFDEHIRAGQIIPKDKS